MILSQSNIKSVVELCEKHNVASLYLFGSTVNDTYTDQSDIDFLVAFKPIDLAYYFSNFLSLKQSLKQTLNRDIDLVEEQTLRNPILIRSINNNKQLIYG